MKKILVSTLACSMAMGLFAAGTANAIQIFLSPQNETDIGPIAAPVNDHAAYPTPSGSGATNVWLANPDDDPDNNEIIDGFGLNIISTTPGVIKFTGVDIYNPHLAPFGPNFADDRWQGTGNGVLSDDSIINFNAAKVTEGWGLDPSLAGFDPFYDDVADAWLIATVFYDVIGGGNTDLFLQIGNNGITTSERQSLDINVEFGGGGGEGDGLQPDPQLNGRDDRNVSSATADGSVTAVPEPNSLVLLMLGFVGAGLFSRRRS